MTTEAFHEHSIKQSKGSVNPYINFSDVTWYEFALPPIDEQRRIVKLISSADALEDCLKRLSESTLTAERAVAVVPSDEEMACQRLGDVCEILVGHPFKSADFVASGVRLARCSNVGPGFLRWDEKGTVYLSAKDAKDHLQFELRADDILIAMDGTFTAEGFKAAVVEASDTPSLLVQRVARLRAVDGGLSAAALLVVVRSSAFRRWLLEGTTQTTVAHVSGRLISDFPIPSDWRESESAVAGSHLKSIDAVSDAVANERTQTRVLRKALLERLLSGNTDHVH
jgi:type I restriction enzyme S subunit